MGWVQVKAIFKKKIFFEGKKLILNINEYICIQLYTKKYKTYVRVIIVDLFFPINVLKYGLVSLSDQD